MVSFLFFTSFLLSLKLNLKVLLLAVELPESLDACLLMAHLVLNFLLKGLNVVEISLLIESNSDSDELLTSLITLGPVGNEVLCLLGITFLSILRSLLSATNFSKDLLKFSLNIPCCESLFMTMLNH